MEENVKGKQTVENEMYLEIQSVQQYNTSSDRLVEEGGVAGRK